MAHYLLSAEAMFSAAHTLPGVDMCDRIHGHNWRVRLTVRVEQDGLGEAGMGVDFRVIEDITKATVAGKAGAAEVTIGRSTRYGLARVVLGHAAAARPARRRLRAAANQ